MNKPIEWNFDKNILLKKTRGISFDDCISAINEKRILKVRSHHNQEKYPDQKYFVLEINEYAYMVPFVEDDKKIFLKTVVPSRKMTKLYLKN